MFLRNGAAIVVVVLGTGCGLSEEPDRFEIRTGEQAGVVVLETTDHIVPMAQSELRTSSTTTTTGVGLRLLARITVPELNGATLHATDVQWRGNRVYASYKTEGPDFGGALQIIDVTSPYNPTLVATALYPNTDINRVEVRSRRLYAAGADSVEGATLESFRVNGNTLDPLGYHVFPSDSTTFASVNQNRLFVSYGATDGGVSVFQINGDTLTHLNSLSQPDARWVDGFGTQGATVISGNPGTLTVYSNALAPNGRVRTANFQGASIGAPTWATRNDDWLFVSADEAGLIVYELDTLRRMGQLPLAGDANGSALFSNNERMFLAQGDQGLLVADVTNPRNPSVLASIDVDDNGSANALAVRGDFVAVADGIGGVKIIRYSLASECGLLTFDTDSDDVEIVAGDVVHDAYAGLGVQIQALDPSGAPGLGVAFDSDNPTGGDDDLAFEGLGNILISQESFSEEERLTGQVCTPDDSANGAVFEFTFDRPVCVSSVTALDIEVDESSAISQYRAGVLLDSQDIPGAGDNSQQEVLVNFTGSCETTRLELSLNRQRCVR